MKVIISGPQRLAISVRIYFITGYGEDTVTEDMTLNFWLTTDITFHPFCRLEINPNKTYSRELALINNILLIQSGKIYIKKDYYKGLVLKIILGLLFQYFCDNDKYFIAAIESILCLWVM